MDSKKAVFVQRHPGYGLNGHIDELTANEYQYLGEGNVYLDHAAATLYTQTQVHQSSELLLSALYANPHSQSEAGQRTRAAVDAVRERILHFFGVTSSEYTVVFTSGATGSCRLLAESIDWNAQSRFTYLVDNHTSVVGMREVARAGGAVVSEVGWEEMLTVATDTSSESQGGGTVSSTSSVAANGSQAQSSGLHLLAIPAESNFSGDRYDLSLLANRSKNVFLLWDCAKRAGTSPIDLTSHHPDFVCLSFYKMFGYPTGIGALLVRNTSSFVLQKRYFGGGSVEALVSEKALFRKELSERMEDGTLPFLTILQLSPGFDLLESIGMEAIAKHTEALTAEMCERLSQLRHSNNASVAVVYGRPIGNDAMRGPIVNFSLLRSNGEFVGHKEVERIASLHGFQIRTGGFCNIGASRLHLGLTSDDIQRQLEAGHVCWDDKDIIDGKPTGSIRVSFGYMSTWEDLDLFVSFIQKFFVERALPAAQDASPTTTTATTTTTTAATTATSDGNGSLIPTVHMLLLYPIKSCAAMRVKDWGIGSNGLVCDREWMLVDQDNKYLNQKKVPRMTLISPHLDLEHNTMSVTAPAKDALTFSLDPQTDEVVAGVCNDSCCVYPYPERVNAWFSSFLGRPCRLVRMVKRPQRTTKLTMQQRASLFSLSTTTSTPPPVAVAEDTEAQLRNQRDATSSTHQPLSLSNEAQYLLVSVSSLLKLQKLLPSDHQMSLDELITRFRANIVVGGVAWEGDPHLEDTWEHVTIGNHALRALGPCTRCGMVCVNSDNASVEREPLKTLSTYRRLKGQIVFGQLFQNDMDIVGEGDSVRISVGDPLFVSTIGLKHTTH